MIIYVLCVDNEVQNNSYTSLKSLCEDSGVSYGSASKGKRIWIKGGVKWVVIETTLIKVKGRSENFKGKNKASDY